MQENNFEKQVQQKMEELQFVPSEPVWQKVALQIGKEKRKRRLVLFLLPLLLATGGAIWFASSYNSDSTKTISQSQQNIPAQLQTQTTPQTKANASVTTPEEPVAKSMSNRLGQDEMQEENKDEKGQKGFETFLKKAEKEKEKRSEKKTASSPLNTKKGNGINEDLHALIVANEIDKRTSEIAEQKTVVDKNVSKTFWDTATTKRNEVAVNIEKDSATNQQADIVNTDVAKTEKDSAIAEVPNQPTLPSTVKVGKKESKWEWTLTARAGSSGLRNGMLNVFSNERADNLYASPSTGNNNPSTGSGGTGNTIPSFSASAEIQKSFAFSIGAGVRKKMFKNAFVVTGLQYSRYSTRAPVGNQVAIDTSVNYNGRTESLSNYYRASGPQKTYTTHYHYLELPLAFEYRLFKTVPLQLQHGISVGYLLSSNALYFDPGARVLYKNSHWLRNTGWHLFTSVDYRLLKASNFSLYAGPQVQYSISPMQQRQEASKHYLFFTGIQSRITF